MTVGRAPRSRALGLVLLTLGGLGVVGLRAVSAPDLPGSAARAEMPSPPAVGSCVVLGDATVEVVPCSAAHSGEVVAAWPAGAQPRRAPTAPAPLVTVSVARQLATVVQDDVCRSWLRLYTGWSSFIASHLADFWLPPEPLAAGRLVSAPAGEGTPDQHWTVCRAGGEQAYHGVLRNSAVRLTDRPDAVSVCLTSGGDAVAFVGCGQPHTVELLGTVHLTNAMMLGHDVGLTPSELRQSCLQLARDRTGNVDPTFGGRLEVAAESVWTQGGRQIEVSSPGWLIPDCLVRTVDGRALNGSVVGLAGRSLPLDG